MSGPWTAWTAWTATMQASGGVCGSPLLFPHRRSGWPCRQDTDHADRTRRQPWPAAATVPDPCPPRATPAAMSAMAAGITHVHAGGRRAGGGRTSVRGLRSQTPAWPSTPPWPRVPYISRPHSGRSGSSGRSSGSLQLSLLFLQGRPCGRPPPAAVLAPATTRREAGRPHRSLTLEPQRSRRERVVLVGRRPDEHAASIHLAAGK
jgi:hypothetical protein